MSEGEGAWKAVLAGNVKWLLLFTFLLALLFASMFDQDTIKVIHALSVEAQQVIRSVKGCS
jgi:hypothetical protein